MEQRRQWELHVRRFSVEESRVTSAYVIWRTNQRMALFRNSICFNFRELLSIMRTLLVTCNFKDNLSYGASIIRYLYTKNFILIIKSFHIHGFAKIFKNLARYRSKNNIRSSKQLCRVSKLFARMS